MTMLPDSPTMTAAQLARVLGLSENSLYRHAKEGTYPVEPIRVGGRLMWRTADVARVLGLVETPAPPDMAVMVERLDDMVAAQQETNRLMTALLVALRRRPMGVAS